MGIQVIDYVILGYELCKFEGERADIIKPFFGIIKLHEVIKVEIITIKHNVAKNIY